MKVPTAVLYDDELADGDVRAYAVLANYAWATGSSVFEMTAEQLAALLGKGKDSAERRTRALADAKWLEVESRRGLARPNRYRILDAKGQNCGTSSRTSAARGTGTSAASGSRKSAAPSNYTERQDEEQVCAHGGSAGLLPSGLPRCPSCRTEAEPAF